MREVIDTYKVGGLLFSGGKMQNQVELTNRAQRQAKVPLMISFDGEWGLAMRLRGMPVFPRNMVLGCIRDNKLLYEYGREVARQCRQIGVQVNFAPVADVNINPENPKDGNRDRLVLSKGHCSPALYATLANRGFFDVEELKSFRNINGKLQGHPDMKNIPGVDMTTGSLGQGLSDANGMAIAGKLDKKVNVTAARFTKSAKEQIEALGGKAEVI